MLKLGNLFLKTVSKQQSSVYSRMACFIISLCLLCSKLAFKFQLPEIAMNSSEADPDNISSDWLLKLLPSLGLLGFQKETINSTCCFSICSSCFPRQLYKHLPVCLVSAPSSLLLGKEMQFCSSAFPLFCTSLLNTQSNRANCLPK